MGAGQILEDPALMLPQRKDPTILKFGVLPHPIPILEEQLTLKAVA